jgi:hypothetical protein
MQRTDFVTHDLRRAEFETACRGFWLAYVMMEKGDYKGAEKVQSGQAAEEPFRVLFAS